MSRVYTLKSDKPGIRLPEKFQLDYEAELNPAQLEAVTSIEGPILCIAGAGSGKTKTLVFRVARMLECGISPDNILLMTFTRKAASQMLTRVGKLIGDKGTRVAGGTYHSFANLILRRYGSAISLPSDFSIIDEPDSSDIINLTRTELGMNKRETRFPQKKTLKEMLSKTINTPCTIEDLLEREYPHFVEHRQEIGIIFTRYREYKNQNHLLDYDDLLLFLLKILENKPETRDQLSERYQYILIDEYQDTNTLQARITELLGKKHRNVMVVGDDAQSIYSFRGARFRNIHEFPQAFPGTKIIKLEQNYRSTQLILAATNTLMTHARTRYEKNLFSKHHQGEKPAVIACADDEEQCRFTAQRILELREEGVPLSHMAVLFRSGFHSFQMELELKRRNIPFVKWGGFKFLEAAHIKDVTAHLRLLQNPLDLVSWQRALLLVDGIGTKSIPLLFEKIKAAANPFDLEGLAPAPRMKLGLARLGAALQKAAKVLAGPPQTTLTFLIDYYLPIVKAVHDDYPKRIRDLDQLTIISGRYETLQDLLTDFALEPPTSSIDDVLSPDADEEDRLILSTVHSAKGLEWHSVFIIWALEGRFPSFNAFKDEETLEEERRLMYVAMTRAKENLYISYPSRFWDPASGEVLSRPSRFLEEIGPEHLETWRLSK